jgi:hypothetical protein
LVAARHPDKPQGRILLVAGWPDRKPDAEPEEPDTRKGVLWVVAAQSGKRLSQVTFDHAPAFDGMAVAGGRAFIALENGSLVCLGDGKTD